MSGVGRRAAPAALLGARRRAAQQVSHQRAPTFSPIAGTMYAVPRNVRRTLLWKPEPDPRLHTIERSAHHGAVERSEPDATASERVVASVRELILDGRLVAGARLGEVELAARLGVSRTPVREALTRLGAEGLVELSPNRGARVATWTRAELEARLRPALGPGAATDRAGRRGRRGRTTSTSWPTWPGGCSTWVSPDGPGPRRAGAAQPRLPRPARPAGRPRGAGGRAGHRGADAAAAAQLPRLRRGVDAAQPGPPRRDRRRAPRR